MLYSQIGCTCMPYLDHYALLDLFQADVIMALAGSNGGSWSTTYSPKPTVRPGRESYMTSGEYEAGVVANTAFQREFRGRLSIPGNATQGVGSGDRISTHAGDNPNLLPTI